MRTLSLLILLMAAVGCNQQQPPVAQLQAPAVATPPAVTQSEAAKAHVQQYLDRIMGGDKATKTSLLGGQGVSFSTIDSAEITSAVQSYTADGEKVDDFFKVIVHVKGDDSLGRKKIEANIDLLLKFEDGKWKVLGSDL